MVLIPMLPVIITELSCKYITDRNKEAPTLRQPILICGAVASASSWTLPSHLVTPTSQQDRGENGKRKTENLCAKIRCLQEGKEGERENTNQRVKRHSPPLKSWLIHSQSLSNSLLAPSFQFFLWSVMLRKEYPCGQLRSAFATMSHPSFLSTIA